MTAKKSTSPRLPKFSAATPESKRTREILFGGFLILISLLLFIAFTSYFFSWKQDQSTLNALTDRTVESANILSKLGAAVSHFFIFKSFGLAAYILAYLFGITGLIFFFNTKKERLLAHWTWGLYYSLWFTLLFGYYSKILPVFSGVMGFEIADFISDYIGSIGMGTLLIFGSLIFIVLHWKVTPEALILKIKPLFKKSNNPTKESIVSKSEAEEAYDRFNAEAAEEDEMTLSVEAPVEETNLEMPIAKAEDAIESEPEEELEIEINSAKEDLVDTNLSQQLVDKYGSYDPTLELSKYLFPTLDLLKDYGDGSITINQEELEANKNKIVNTLKNYKIEIAQIKANIGPTVTLYEIVPAAGIRISKIKNLEDDIALSLSALGIRIIAPIPGKGTIGIEVPNQKPSIVSMRSVIASQKFQKAEMELPIALGKTISNETFVVDLAKMPHLLMAGATGQGKSVGLNAVLTSLLYKKHPAEVKFVLVDPKKVELNIYNKIERHYLAKLPDSEDAIITDNTKVIHTLNSLCIEMDNRYELLKNGMCRNLKEYNTKFKARKLNPDDGHCFLPYIVLVVDEFADLIMTAGKEVETPIARLAQLARAIGIHLIIATQRPSVNVITGIIKANFPARIAFRVTSKIDSRTILDNGGADQLIGRGDMLYTQGNDLTRIQCAFVDTPEVEKVVEYIGSQKAYAEAHLLPEFVGEESTATDIDINDRDALFREAAEVIVTAQQGSASLLQRKLKLGYNRAGRIVDQMEAAGIVGPFEGSKARQVLIPDLTSLEQLLNNE
ncbi:MAG: DNA translocase FtsK 4TM domain-containing protein [Flavobacteriaceae bacterium]|nr:DNA translocase FtsK 4TM domain-containing protein [Flavobacteriaceae bacterium]MDG1091920.1 DNA translocase FtsK 4TM domain-containing protein [Flavobacteriaceae bacterium]